MVMTAEQVQELQNSEQTDFEALDQKLVDASNWDRNRFAHDDKLHVRWFMKARKDEDASRQAGRAVFKDTEYIEIMVPGDKNNIIQRPAWAQDYQRFQKQYQQFKAGHADQVTGTPLKLAPFLSEAQVEELAYFKIRTIEQLANMNDAIVQRFMGATEFKREAQLMLAKMNSNEEVVERMKEMQQRIKELELQASAKAPEKSK